MKSVLVAAALLGISAAKPWSHEFISAELDEENMHALFFAWRRDNNKVYASVEEEMKRFAVWQYNMERIALSNNKHARNELKYTLRMNAFGDMTDEEFHAMYNCPTGGSRTKERPTGNVMLTDKQPEAPADGATVDWVAAGKVTPVKNQGQCGSCWSFSATGAMECDYAIKHGGGPTSLSEQMLVDCSTAYGNEGCNGGWYYDAWKYAMSVGGLCTESAYPYTGVQGTCRASSCGTKYDDPTGYTQIKADDETSLQTAVNAGCVSVAIQANQFAFQYYSGGVLTGTCGTQIDHAVLAVGYGTLNGEAYWYVKNSWGASWGVNGYVYICKNCGANGSKGECGIDMYPYVPTF